MTNFYEMGRQINDKRTISFYELMKMYDLDESIFHELIYRYKFSDCGNIISWLQKSGIEDTKSYIDAYVEFITTNN